MGSGAREGGEICDLLFYCPGHGKFKTRLGMCEKRTTVACCYHNETLKAAPNLIFVMRRGAV